MRITDLKKAFPRFLAGIVAVISLTVSLAAVDVSAAVTVLRGDINNDGVVNLADVISVTQYTKGIQNYSADRCDVDRNGVADVEDVSYVLSIVLGTNPSGTVTVSSPTANNTETVSYRVFTYSSSTNRYTISRTYSITPTISVGSISPMRYPTVPMIDNRVPYSDSAIVYAGGGTGFIVGPNKVATNAHCIDYGSSTITQIVGRKQISASLNGQQYTNYNISEIHVPVTYEDTTDYALLKIDTSVDLEATYGKMELGAITNDTINLLNSYFEVPNAPKHILIAGYSQSPNGRPLTMAWGTAFLIDGSIPKADKYIWSNAFTTNGGSGSPIMYDVDANINTTADRVCIGLFMGGNSDYVGGPRITAQLLRFFLNNPSF